MLHTLMLLAVIAVDREPGILRLTDRGSLHTIGDWRELSAPHLEVVDGGRLETLMPATLTFRHGPEGTTSDSPRFHRLSHC
jgi:hypothetical protein